VLQCVAVCCSVLQCSVLQWGDNQTIQNKACRNILQCIAICCSALQRVAACCSALQRVAVSVAVRRESDDPKYGLLDISQKSALYSSNMVNCSVLQCSVAVKDSQMTQSTTWYTFL